MSWPRAVSFLVALTLAGCGQAAPEEGGGEQAPPGPATELTVTFRPAGDDGEARQATLTCDPAGGTHPDPEAACAALAAQANALERRPGDAVCTDIFGGPETADLRGTVEGTAIRASFSRENGCEIQRWDALEPLLRLSG